jgi:hypothetical protein
MNIIEAWQKAKEGQSIRRSLSGKNGITFIKETSGDCWMGRKDFLWKTLMDGRSFDDSISDCVLLAPDWEIVKEPVKEHRKIKVVWGVLFDKYFNHSVFPSEANVTIEWDEPTTDRLATKCEGPRSKNGKCGRGNCYNCY